MNSHQGSPDDETGESGAHEQTGALERVGTVDQVLSETVERFTRIEQQRRMYTQNRIGDQLAKLILESSDVGQCSEIFTEVGHIVLLRG